MDKQHFEDRLRIIAFREITDRLREKRLITEEEFRKISQQIDRMEEDLLKGKSSKTPRNRKPTELK